MRGSNFNSGAQHFGAETNKMFHYVKDTTATTLRHQLFVIGPLLSLFFAFALKIAIITTIPTMVKTIARIISLRFKVKNNLLIELLC
jgi:hypothetical protein